MEELENISSEDSNSPTSKLRLNNITKKYKNMLNIGRFADFTFIVEGVEIKAHKCVLAGLYKVIY